jgi:hypothetical protein
MNIDLIPYFILGIVLVLAVIALAVWRKVVAGQEDDTLHVLAEPSVITHQVSVAHKLEVIDKWGKLLTIVTTLYLIAVVVFYAYQHWVKTSTSGVL